jgi:hypothetical protein
VLVAVDDEEEEAAVLSVPVELSPPHPANPIAMVAASMTARIAFVFFIILSSCEFFHLSI